MARKIQSSSSQTGAKKFTGLLGNAIFWVIVAVVLPVKTIVGLFPELAPVAPWAPIVCYGLALLSFVRAVLSLRGTLGRVQTPGIGRQKVSSGAARPDRPKPTASKSGLPITRTPTVQRMR